MCTIYKPIIIIMDLYYTVMGNITIEVISLFIFLVYLSWQSSIGGLYWHTARMMLASERDLHTHTKRESQRHTCPRCYRTSLRRAREPCESGYQQCSRSSWPLVCRSRDRWSCHDRAYPAVGIRIKIDMFSLISYGKCFYTLGSINIM